MDESGMVMMQAPQSVDCDQSPSVQTVGLAEEEEEEEEEEAAVVDEEDEYADMEGDTCVQAMDSCSYRQDLQELQGISNGTGLHMNQDDEDEEEDVAAGNLGQAGYGQNEEEEEEEEEEEDEEDEEGECEGPKESNGNVGQTPVSNRTPPKGSRLSASSPFLSVVFPVSRVRRLIKSECEIQMVGSEAIFLIAKSAELFLEQFVEDAFGNMADEKRLCLSYKDVSSSVASAERLEFLADFVPEKVLASTALNEART